VTFDIAPGQMVAAVFPRPDRHSRPAPIRVGTRRARTSRPLPGGVALLDGYIEHELMK